MPLLISPTGQDIRLRPVRPNLGIEAAYRRKLLSLLDELHGDLVAAILSAWERNPPAAVAQDAQPYWSTSAWDLHKVMAKVAERWRSRLERLPATLAQSFTDDAMGRSDAALKAALKAAGFVVKFSLTDAQKDIIQGSVVENVNLITKLANNHIADVRTSVMRSVSAGRDIKGLAEELENRLKIDRRRAVFIARDQNNKATSAIQKTRQQELGLKARWMHSGGGRHPRREHVRADGTIYDPAEGCKIAGRLIWPGQDINCGCTAQSIIPGGRREASYRGMPEKLRTSALSRSRSVTKKEKAA